MRLLAAALACGLLAGCVDINGVQSCEPLSAQATPGDAPHTVRIQAVYTNCAKSDVVVHQAGSPPGVGRILVAIAFQGTTWNVSVNGSATRFDGPSGGRSSGAELVPLPPGGRIALDVTWNETFAAGVCDAAGCRAAAYSQAAPGAYSARVIVGDGLAARDLVLQAT